MTIFFIDDAGPKGLSSAQFSKTLGIRKLDTRGQIKTLERKGLVQTYMKHDGRQKTAYYVAKRYQIKDPVPYIPDRHHKKEVYEKNSRKAVLTERQLARRNIIMDYVNDNGIVTDRHKIYRIIRDAEVESGLKGTMDRKSLKSLLAGLERDEKLKMFKFNIETESKKEPEEITLICAFRFNESDPQIKSVIEQEKMKLHFKPSDQIPQMEPVAKDKAKESIEESIEEMKNMVDGGSSPKKSLPSIGRVYNAKYGRINGVKPKFLRTRELHKYLFYLTRDYQGSKNFTKTDFLNYIRQENIDINATIEDELESMDIYTSDLSWRTFIPPLPQHQGWQQGWCLMSDIILRLPLSLFLQLVCVNYKVEGLDAYKDHPIRKHYLVKNLPDDIKRMLLNSRKYMASIYDETKKMIYMGLAQISGEVFKEKEHCFIYINR